MLSVESKPFNSLEEDEWVDIDEALADLEDEKRYQQQETP